MPSKTNEGRREGRRARGEIRALCGEGVAMVKYPNGIRNVRPEGCSTGIDVCGSGVDGIYHIAMREWVEADEHIAETLLELCRYVELRKRMKEE